MVAQMESKAVSRVRYRFPGNFRDAARGECGAKRSLRWTMRRDFGLGAAPPTERSPDGKQYGESLGLIKNANGWTGDEREIE